MVETHKHRFQGPAASTVQLLTDLPEGELAGETLGFADLELVHLILKESVVFQISVPNEDQSRKVFHLGGAKCEVGGIRNLLLSFLPHQIHTLFLDQVLCTLSLSSA